MLSKTTMPTPRTDPVPWITRRFRSADLFKEHGWDGEHAARLLDVVSTSVAAMQDDAHPYRVVLQSTGTAATDLRNRVVHASAEAMFDVTLTPGQRAAVMLGLVLHEVGHIRYHRETAPVLENAFGAQTRAIHAISNIAADLHDEALAREAFPGAADAVDVTLWFVSGKGQTARTRARLGTFAERVNALCGATRYPWNTDWSAPAAIDWLRWARDWGQRCMDSVTPDDHVALVREALLRCGTPDPVTDDGEPQPGRGGRGGNGQPGDDQPGDEPGEDGEGEGTDGQPGEGKGQPGGGNGEQPGEQPGEGGGEGEGDEAGDGEQQDSGGRGSTGGGGVLPPHAQQEDPRIDTDTCTGDKARSQRDRGRDAALQEAATTYERGQRSGRNERTYKHPHWSSLSEGRERKVVKRTFSPTGGFGAGGFE